jgi:hypothetical protein
MENGIVNIIILVVGVVLLVLGFNEYGAFGSRALRFWGGGISNQVLILLIAGAACTAYGLMNTLKKK